MTLNEVRENIDRVDKDIKKLFAERMQLAEQVAQVKAQTADNIYKPDREETIIEKQSKDMDSDILKEYKALIKKVMAVSRKYQYGRTLELRDCFPFSYEKEACAAKHPAMLRQELYICSDYPKDIVKTYASYEAIAKAIQSGEADAGMGIIEEIGQGVSDALNDMLADQGFYISRCRVVNDGGQKKKVVEFGRKLSVLPDHNRLKIVFICPNRSGALGSILSMIADYDVNLTEIHSMPFKENDKWNYRFFLELELNLLEKEGRALIYQLSCETQSMKILGSYACQGDF